MTQLCKSPFVLQQATQNRKQNNGLVGELRRTRLRWARVRSYGWPSELSVKRCWNSQQSPYQKKPLLQAVGADETLLGQGKRKVAPRPKCLSKSRISYLLSVDDLIESVMAQVMISRHTVEEIDL